MQALELVVTGTKDIYIRQDGGKETSHGSVRS
jgi:hypothetical protein